MLYQKEQLELLAINWNKTKSRSILRGDRISWTGLRAGNTRERSIGLLAAVGGTEQRLGPVTTREGDSGEGGGGGVIMIRQGLLMSGICGDWTWWGLVCPGSDPDTITTNYSKSDLGKYQKSKQIGPDMKYCGGLRIIDKMHSTKVWNIVNRFWYECTHDCVWYILLKRVLWHQKRCTFKFKSFTFQNKLVSMDQSV